MYCVELTRAARKQLRQLERRDKQLVAEVIDSLEQDPFIGKKLQGDLSNYWSARAWPYRVIYTINKKIVTVTVVEIGHRKDVYRRARR